MKIYIDDTKLKLLMEEKRDLIGNKIQWDALVSALSFIISVATASYGNFLFIPKLAVKTFFLIIAVAYFFKVLYECINAKTHKYDHKDLTNDILSLNTIQHNHSLIAVKDTFNVDSKRYLLYFDEKWDCKLFLNFKTVDENNENNIIENLSSNLGVDRNSIQCRIKGTQVKEKYSVSHKEMRTYNHRLYEVSISDFPEYMRHDHFVRNGKHYYWMSIENMRKDKEIQEKNLEIVEFVNSQLKKSI